MGVAFGDFNGDGLTDVFVANDSVPNFLFRNLGGGKFKESGVEAGVAYLSNGNAVASVGADFRDYDNDGLDDIAVDAMYFDIFPLLRNQGKPHFCTEATVFSGVALATRKGFKPLADYVHSKGLKFGMHIMRGIPRRAVNGDLPNRSSHITTVNYDIN